MKRILPLLFALLCIVSLRTWSHPFGGVTSQRDTIPKAIRVNPNGAIVSAPLELSYPLKDLDAQEVNDVFPSPPCLEGKYYVGFQLNYDLSDAQTDKLWSANVSVSLLEGNTVLWTKPLVVRMSDQTFTQTFFHDEPLACVGNYRFRIESKQTTADVPRESIYLKVILHRKTEDWFDPAIMPTVQVTSIGNHMAVAWTEMGEGTIAYDVEWVFIGEHDAFAGTTGPEAFAYREPARVTVSGFYFERMAYYPAGQLWYRVRAVGFHPDHPGHRIPGQWGYSSSIRLANNSPSKNWQMQTVYAEEGKYKTVVQYLDRTMRARQSVTNLSTTQMSLVAETYYDYEGRQTVTTMASPWDNPALDYRPSFNRWTAIDQTVQTNTGTAREKFHYDNGRLENSKLSDQTGAGQYYSPNDLVGKLTDPYRPDAEGYAYATTEYTNDGTGRISRQSGVGRVFRGDSTLATRYYYGEASPTQLIRLFGRNVGEASHYKRNLIVDPNGQVSVSYLDQEGRTVATALAGIPPQNVDMLKSYTDLPRDSVYENLNAKNKQAAGISHTSHKIMNVAPNAGYAFSYDLAAVASQVQETGCVACAFDLTITLTNPEGKRMDLGAIAGNQAGDQFSYERKNLTATLCNTTLEALRMVRFKLILPEVGDYTLTKTLVPHELSFEKLDTLVRDKASIQQAINEIKISYVTDASVCDLCDEQCSDANDMINKAVDEIAREDCDNILRRIEADLRAQHDSPGSEDVYEVRQEDVKNHRLYCQYLLCRKNIESDKFEKNLGRVKNWASATAYNTIEKMLTADPFFNGDSLAGFGHKDAMRDKLNAIQLGGNANYAGTLSEVTDPTNTNFYTNWVNDQSKSYHLLYQDLMDQRSTMTATEYEAKLSHQRWTMYRTQYLEAKRKLKLELDAIKSCAPELERLQQQDGLPTIKNGVVDKDGIIKLGVDNNLIDPSTTASNAVAPSMSDDELNMKLLMLSRHCGVFFSRTDSTQLRTNLAGYFNASKKNFLRVFLRHDFADNTFLQAIQTTLRANGCALDDMLEDDPFVCERSVESVQSGCQPGDQLRNLLMNPTFETSNPGCNVISDDCFAGWENANGQPRLQSGSVAAMSGTRCGTTNDALRGSFVENLKPGKQYKLCFSYRVLTAGAQANAAVPVSPQINLDRDYFYMQLSSGTAYRNSIGCSFPGPVYDRVKVDRNGSIVSDSVIWKIGAQSFDTEWRDVCVTFAAESASSYLFLSMMHTGWINYTTNIYYKNLAMWELCDGGATPTFTRDNVTASLLNINDEQQSLLKQTHREMQSLENGIVSELRANVQKRSGHTTIPTSMEFTALMDLYDATNGPSWKMNQGWRTASREHPQDMSWWTGVVVNAEGHVVALQLSDNGLNGTLPESIGGLSELEVLNVSHNQLRGSLPTQMWRLSRLKFLSVSDNALSGPVPSIFFMGSKLQTFDVSNNELSGAIPDLSDVGTLENVYLSSNNFSGEIPSSLGSLSLLKNLYLNSNALTGNIPADLGNLSMLTTLHIYDNQLSGTIPSSLAGLSNLKQLMAGKNDFTPAPIPAFVYNLNRLNVLHLDDCNLTGSISPQIGNLRELNSLILSRNQLTGSLPTEIGDLTNLVSLWITTNNLEGEIPSSIAQLSKLESLALSENQLTGAFPQIGSLTRLQSVDLDNNRMSGAIPSFLSNLTALKVLSVSGNKFSGELPNQLSLLSGIQFLRLRNNKFYGNIPSGLRVSNQLLIDGNEFTFTNVLPARPSLSGVLFLYSPQDSVGVRQTVHGTKNRSLTLEASIDCNTNPASKFQWFRRDGSSRSTPLQATATEAGYTYQFNPLTDAAAGNYYYEITNPGATSLKLTSRMIKLVVDKPADSLCIKYDSAAAAVFTVVVDLDAYKRACLKRLEKQDSIIVAHAIEEFIASEITALREEYQTNCLKNVREDFSYKHVNAEYHYTLYYYDQGGNLVQTIPPTGVKPLSATGVTAFLAGDRRDPLHELSTRYRYSSLNAVTLQQSPDAGIAKTWYNAKTQVRLSQSAQQLVDNLYSFTRYDKLGRAVEVGEIDLQGTLSFSTLQDSIQTLNFPNAAYWISLPATSHKLILSDVTRTHYDAAAAPNKHNHGFTQTYLRTRVSWVEVLDKNSADTTATYYSYDVHGNVHALLQQLPGLSSKRIDYQYDLVSGKVNYVFYQYGKHDQLIHRYAYDSDNRITDVYTSTDAYLWTHEAAYFYYFHGPLARIELGQHRVQGLDYYYTLQGWIKGVNMPVAGDPGADGAAGSHVAHDAFAYTLGYFKGDYKPIGGNVMADHRDKLWERTRELNAHKGLYNGNISWMITDLPKLGNKRVQAMVYKYDQLNRITKSQSLTVYDKTIGFTTRSLTTPGPYDETFSYDANGNLLTLKRYDEAAKVMDDFSYSYYAGTNRLKQVKPNTRDTTYTGVINSSDAIYRNITAQGGARVVSGDPVNMEATNRIHLKSAFQGRQGVAYRGHIVPDDGNYRYDRNGNLIADKEQGSVILWTPYGKVREVHTHDTVRTRYRYDGMGNRVMKTVQTGSEVITTRYVRDASRNVMSIYSDTTVVEQILYGSVRIGAMKKHERAGRLILGKREYELSNHLGNVLATITDNVKMTADSVLVTVVGINDYHPFGLEMKGRSWLDKQHQRGRYGFNGKEKDSGFGNVNYDYGFRIYDPRIGKFLSVDPLTTSYPWLTPYQFASNRPIIATDIDGLESNDECGQIIEPNIPNKPNQSYNKSFIILPVTKQVTKEVVKRSIARGMLGNVIKYSGWIAMAFLMQGDASPKPLTPDADQEKYEMDFYETRLQKDGSLSEWESDRYLDLLAKHKGIYMNKKDLMNPDLFKSPEVRGALENFFETRGVKNVSEFYAWAARLKLEEKIVEYRIAGSKFAEDNGLIINSRLSKRFNRDIYSDKDGNLYSLDTRHGEFEVLNAKGQHQKVIDFSGRTTKSADKSGKHNLED
ncbi:leucine-rich repeat domain-containing protein [Chryseolinea lacunae]|uniref:Disease resistance R13L4/SHOC-2-like LRR domain-containing protein n=1 Tax=Chryseolinea lacunae TaxID=2801331 RepID=A0ABS1KZI4_9BACT|nr:RHS repeat-associated core domain-containing protein [Chryseolinea lacunae]MBL0744799.1 hypothetical protein [Chryseolinea lacunae]